MLPLADGCFVLASYKPRRYVASEIGTELLQISRKLGLKPYPNAGHAFGHPWGDFENSAEVRGPQVVFDRVTSPWHHDGWAGGRATDVGLLLWASVEPTEFLRSDGTIIQPKPFELVLVGNHIIKHRSPPAIQQLIERWWFRQVVVWRF